MRLPALEDHLPPVLILAEPEFNVRLMRVAAKRFQTHKPDADLVKSWPVIARSEKFKIHRASVKEMAALHQDGKTVLFFRDPEWTLPLIHPKCVGKGIATAALRAEFPCVDRPTRKATSFSLPGFLTEQAAWRAERVHASQTVPDRKVDPAAWNVAAFRRANPEPELALYNARQLRDYAEEILSPGNIPAICMLRQAQMEIRMARAALGAAPPKPKDLDSFGF